MKLKNILFTVEIKGRELRRIILRTYENKDELKNEINKSFAKYISEFDIIPESLKDKRVEEVDRTPAEISLIRLAGQLLLLNGNQMKERVFMSRPLRIILSGINLANYINGLQIHMRICRCRS